MTLPLPTAFPTQNTYRLVHQSAEPDSARLAEMTADAIALLRGVADAAHTLPTADLVAVKDAYRDLTAFALRGDVLSPEMQIAAINLIDTLDDRAALGSTDEALTRIRDDLRKAMTLGRRVFDLIIAEHQIAALRLDLCASLIEDEADDGDED